MASDAANPLAGIDIWKTPLLPPPPGVTSNFVNPESRGPLIERGMYAVLAIMVVFLALRVYTRVRLQALGLDDYLSLLSAAFIITNSGLTLSFIGNPEGKHGWDIPLGEVLTNHFWLEVTFATLWTYSLSNMFIKLTFFAFFLRVFNPSSWARWAAWAGIAITTCFYVATSVAYTGLCARSGVPIWTSMQELRCANGNLMVSKAQGWFGLISDVYIFAIPMATVWRLHMTVRRRLGLTAVFSVGLTVIAISAVSLAKRYESVAQGADRTWTNSIVYLYTTLELAIGLICSCMPVVAVTMKGPLAKVNTVQTSKAPSHSSSSHENLDPVHSWNNAHRPTAQAREAAIPLESLNTMKTTDQDYHVQLQRMNE
ncbi:hypothetical protein PG984_010406 [Apiospora sp. TS-2023a]